jgi:hypothetical protein
MGPTILYYESRRSEWKPSMPPPGPFARIKHDFDNFATGLTYPIWRLWRYGDLKGVRQIWQR